MQSVAFVYTDTQPTAQQFSAEATQVEFTSSNISELDVSKHSASSPSFISVSAVLIGDQCTGHLYTVRLPINLPDVPTGS